MCLSVREFLQDFIEEHVGFCQLILHVLDHLKDPLEDAEEDEGDKAVNQARRDKETSIVWLINPLSFDL